MTNSVFLKKKERKRAFAQLEEENSNVGLIATEIHYFLEKILVTVNDNNFLYGEPNDLET